MVIHSEAFGFNHTLSIEGSTCEYHNKYHNFVSNEEKVKIYFHSHFSDESTVLLVAKKNCTAVVRILRIARQKWLQLNRVSSREGADARTLGQI